jgi:hypothetical protein
MASCAVSEIKTAEDILDAIEVGYNAGRDGRREEKPRRYIGASMIGTDCDAEVALNLRGFPSVTPAPKMKRIFNLGHALEDMIVRDLKDVARLPVFDRDPLTGKQYAFHDVGGHVVCHLDGMIETADGLNVLEIKSMNEAMWKRFKKHGVKVSHPKYYAQLQMMMAMAKLQRSVFIAYNKNTSEYHCEFVDFDSLEFDFIEAKANRALGDEAHRVAADPDDWRCARCFKRTSCWDLEPVEPACSRCSHAVSAESGDWYCELHKHTAEDVCGDYQQYFPRSK